MADPIPPVPTHTTPTNGPGVDPLTAAMNATIPSAATNAQPLYSGSVSLWMASKSIFGAMFGELLGIGLVMFGVLTGIANPLSLVALIAGIALLLSSSIMLFYVILSARSTRYTITHRHIERELGLFVKKVDSLPLGSVKSVDLKQSFIERMLGIGTVEIYCGPEGSRPTWLLEGIPNPRPIYEKTRDAVMDLTLRRGVILE